MFPDNWNNNAYILNNTNNGFATFSSNTISASEWLVFFEANGALFLPAAGFRCGKATNSAGWDGDYWSATCYNSNFVFCMAIFDLAMYSGNGSPSTGRSVRLVQDANP